MAGDLRLFLPVAVLASTLVGFAYTDPIVSSADGQAQLAMLPGSSEHKPGMMRRVKPRAVDLSMKSQPGHTHFLVLLCVVTALAGLAHQVWGKFPTASLQAHGKLSRPIAPARALTNDPRLLFVFVALACTLAGCALYLAGPSHGKESGAYMRRVPHNGAGVPSVVPMQHVNTLGRPHLIRRTKPRAPDTFMDSQQGPHGPMHFVFMFCFVGVFGCFAHQVWGTVPSGQDVSDANGTTPCAKGSLGGVAAIVALTKNPRRHLAFVALAAMLAGCALHFAGPSNSGGYMRRVPRDGNVNDATAKTLVVPKALEDPPRVHFLFALCVIVALIAFGYQVWGRMKTLRRSSTDTKAPKV